MLDRDNAVGFVLLGLCTVIAVFMGYSIATGTRPRYTGPDWLIWILAALFIGGTLYGLLGNRFRRSRDKDLADPNTQNNAPNGDTPRDGGRGMFGPPQWPDPRTGPRRQGWRRFWPF